MPRSPFRTTLLAALALTAPFLPRPAFAQARASDVAAAQSLFDEARALTRAGKFAEACPKFEESERLDGGPGTEFNLADCYEHAGRTASAWAGFAAVADSLRAMGQHAREKVARDRAAALEPKLTRVAVNVTMAARVVGLEIKRDGDLVREAQWGTGVPVDPGKHTIAAAAPGKQPWQQAVDAVGSAKTVMVEVPVLSPAPATPLAASAPVVVEGPLSVPAPSTEAPASEPSHGMGGQRIVALVVGGLGVVGLGVGGYFGSQAISKHSQYAPLCPNGVCSDPSAVQMHDDAATDATIATVSLAAGGAALVGGVILWLTAPSSPSAVQRTGVRVLPSVSARGGELVLQGRW